MSAWTSVNDSLPPMGPETEPWQESELVLATDGRSVFVSYFQRWPEAESEWNCWKIAGRDSYTFDGVTHWTQLPELPK